MNAADRRGRIAAEQRTDPRPDHAVAPERDLDAFDMLAHVRMRALEIGHHHLGPFFVAGAGELAAYGRGVLVGKRVVPGPNRRSAIAAALVRRAYVAKARAVVKHVVPRGRR